MSASTIIVITRPPTSPEGKEDPLEFGPHLYGSNSIDAARQYLADILSQHGEP